MPTERLVLTNTARDPGALLVKTESTVSADEATTSSETLCIVSGDRDDVGDTRSHSVSTQLHVDANRALALGANSLESVSTGIHVGVELATVSVWIYLINSYSGIQDN